MSDIKQAGRNTQGVKLINIRDNDSIASVSVVAKSEDPEVRDAEGASDAGAQEGTPETPQNEE